MLQFSVLHWEEIKTKILPLCRLFSIHRVCIILLQKLQFRFCVHDRIMAGPIYSLVVLYFLPLYETNCVQNVPRKTMAVLELTNGSGLEKRTILFHWFPSPYRYATRIIKDLCTLVLQCLFVWSVCRISYFVVCCSCLVTLADGKACVKVGFVGIAK